MSMLPHEEQWRQVPGYENLYKISTRGQVLSLPRNTTRGGILRQAVDKQRRHYVTLTKDGVQKRHAVHQLVLLAFTGPCPDGMEVCHNDGNPENNCVGNLRYDTHAGNMRDMRIHGTDSSLNKTHCPRGHAYDEENTRLYDGKRFCRQCAKETGGERQKKYYQRKKEAGTLVKYTDMTEEQKEKARAKQRRYRERKRGVTE